MEIPVLVERTNASEFRARSGGPLVLTAEAPTRDEALRRLRELIMSRLAAGAELVALEVPVQSRS